MTNTKMREIRELVPASVVDDAEARGILQGGWLQFMLIDAIQRHDELVQRLDADDPEWREHEEDVAREIRAWREERQRPGVTSRP